MLFSRKPAAVEKTYEAWAGRRPGRDLDFSFVIQCHNKAEGTLRLVKVLRECPGAEIVVIDDGSEISQSRKLLAELTRGNEFILRANDLYEVVMYDRALSFCRGKWVALLQDDNVFDDLQWVYDAAKVFRQHSDLAVLGGRNAVNFEAYEKTPDGQRGDYEVHRDGGQRKNSFKISFAGTVSRESTRFRFVQTVNRSPMWVRRSHFVNVLKEINQDYGPFQWDDAELCFRAWEAGLSVGWYPIRYGKGELEEGGMRIWNNQLHHRQDETNARRLYQVWERRFSEIQKQVDQKNRELGL